MFSEAQADHTRPGQQSNEAMDFSRRAVLRELMDDPSSYEELRDCLHDLGRVNQVTFAYHPTLAWWRQLIGTEYASQRLHIVDVGSGGGDMLREVERWADSAGIPVRLTGIDLNPHAVQAAREFTGSESAIRWITGDMYSIDSLLGPVDVVISSLFTHHLNDSEIVRFLIWMERVSKRGWLINDLVRSRLSYIAFRVLARAARWHRFVQHDGPISIRRGFQPAEWRRSVEAAGLPLGLVRIEKHWPGRLTVSRMKQP